MTRPEQPNLLFVLSDDQRWDTLGCMGNTLIQTPHLDALGQEGVVFTNNFCTTSICCTSRASIITGLYGSPIKQHDFSNPLPAWAWEKSYPMLLRHAGYQTAFVGKWGIGGDFPTSDFDLFDGDPGQPPYFVERDGKQVHYDRDVGNRALKFLSNLQPDKPFCLSVSFKAPHCLDQDMLFHPDPIYRDLYQNVEIPLPKTASEAYFQKLPSFLQESECRVRWKPRFATPELFQNNVKDYYRLITGMDAIIGEFVARLKELGQLENTVIVFTSDNGFFLGEHGLAGKWLMRNESLRTPLLIYDPRLPDGFRGRKVDRMALNIDIAPTLLAYAGIDIPSQMVGQSLKPLVEAQSIPWRDRFFYEHHLPHPRIPRNEGVRTTEWTYTRYLDTDPLYEELFNHLKDPYEEQNLASDPAFQGILEELRLQWQQMKSEIQKEPLP